MRENIKKVNIVFLVTVIFSLTGGLIIPSITVNVFAIMILSQIILIIPAAFYLYQTKCNVLTVFRFKKIKPSIILWIILFSYLVSPVMNFINMVSMLFVENMIQNTIQELVSKSGIVIATISIAIIPALFEETVYRGMFYDAYRRLDPRKGMILSAFLFGLMHLNFNQFFYAFAMGMVFILLIEATDSIWGSIIIHFCINFSSVFMLYITNKIVDMLGDNIPNLSTQLDAAMAQGVDKAQIIQYLPVYGISAIAHGVLAFIVLKIIAKKCGRYEYLKSLFSIKNNSEKVTVKQFFSAPLIVGVITCLAIMLMQELVSLL